MTSVERLRAAAWLCIMRYQFSCGINAFCLPDDVIDQLEREGLICNVREMDGEDGVSVRITEQDALLADLESSAWGIDPMLVA